MNGAANGLASGPVNGPATGPATGRPATGPVNRVTAFLAAAWGTLTGVMREIADENACARHLAWHGTPHSPEEYRCFAEHRLAATYKRAKCC